MRANFAFRKPYGTMQILALKLRIRESSMTQSSTTELALQYLVAEGTVAETNGHGSAFALASLAGQTVVLALRITAALEQESLHVSLWGSPDAQNWGTVALFWFPQVFEVGITPAAVDLRSRPELKFLQARWEVNRWGRGNPRPHFEFSLEIQPAGI